MARNFDRGGTGFSRSKKIFLACIQAEKTVEQEDGCLID